MPKSGSEASPASDWVSLGGPVYGPAELEALRQVLEDRRRFRMGSRTRAFEARVAALLGKRHGVMVNSGSSAIELGVHLLGLPAGSEVITPPLTFSTTVAPLVRAGLVPAFVDAAPGSFVIDVDRIAEMLSERTRMILAPNLIGNVPDWDRIREIADRHDLIVFEDSCDTLGASLRGRPPGARAHVSATSFNESHLITCLGTGGLVAFDDPEQDAEARLARNWGRSSSRHGSGPLDYPGDLFSAELDGVPYHRDFVFERLGFNWEGSEPMAAFGLAQLDRLDEFADLHRAHFAAHASYFATHESFFELPQQHPDVKTAWMSYPIVVRGDAPFDRRTLHEHLEKNRVGTRPVWSGNLLRHPGFRDIPHRAAPGGYPVADAVLRGGLLIPAHHGLSGEQVARVHQVLDEFLTGI